MTGKIRLYTWFSVANAFIVLVTFLRYFEYLPFTSLTPLSFSFALASSLCHALLLSFSFGLVLLPVSFIQNNKLRRSLFALVGAGGLTFLLIDTVVFAQYRFHINMVVVSLVFSDDIVSFPFVTWAMVISGLIAAFAAEYALAVQLEKRVANIKAVAGKIVFAVFVVTFLVANIIYMWGSANSVQSVVMIKRYLPVYKPLAASKFMVRLGFAHEDGVENEKTLNSNDKSDLNYPIKPVEGTTPDDMRDIVIIAIDSWRYDTFSPETSPNLWAFGKQGVVFRNHLSTGNSTRAGIFGLFYGLPATYWHSFAANQRSTVFIDRLQQLDYQLGVFASAQITRPEFNTTIFRNVMNLRIKSDGDSASSKDRDITDDWKQWYKNTDKKKPSFTFLFYDAPHAYNYPKGYTAGFAPLLQGLNYLTLDNDTDPAPLFNTYKTSVHYVDGLIGEVIEEMRAAGRLEKSLIIITGDHGQEMNDNKLNFWGHNGNFTDAQVKVPFIIVAPDAVAKVNNQYINSMTSHEDVVPTIMKNYLGVTNSTSDYSTGIDLYGKFVRRDWVISSKYSGYAVISGDTISVINSMGGYEIYDRNYRPKDVKLDSAQMKQAFEAISRFMK